MDRQPSLKKKTTNLRERLTNQNLKIQVEYEESVSDIASPNIVFQPMAPGKNQRASDLSDMRDQNILTPLSPATDRKRESMLEVPGVDDYKGQTQNTGG